MMKLPIGIQEFSKLREGRYLYVDKTKEIYDLATSSGHYFLARPRRFGKSLLINTIKELFSGRKEYFEGLWIEDKWNWERKNPVLHFSFSKLDYQGLGLKTALLTLLTENAEQLGIKLAKKTLKSQFTELLEKLSQRDGKVVLLVDEYDKPIIDYLGKDNDLAVKHQNTLKTFYSVIKDSDKLLEFFFVTGVSKFSKTGIFSELNNLDDLTLDPGFATATGYTQRELEHYFDQRISELAQKDKMDRTALLAKIKDWYNGYTWDGENYLYNPFSILNYFKKGIFLNFWFSSGTPTFLIKLLKERFYYNFECVEVGMSAFESYDISNLETAPLLFQTGYLTIKNIIPDYGVYELGYPNKEVRDSMLQHLIGAFRHGDASKSSAVAYQIEKAFLRDDIGDVIKRINTMFATIPYEIFKSKSEAYFHSLVHLLFTYLGVRVQSQVMTSKGRADAVVQTQNYIYILEFKLDKTVQEALDQIKKKGYADRYKGQNKKIKAVGINFSSKAKEIDDWDEEEIG